jgi:hypothetical protein
VAPQFQETETQAFKIAEQAFKIAEQAFKIAC